MSNVFAAIQNRDAGALARMMGPDNHHDQQDNFGPFIAGVRYGTGKP